MKCAPKGVRFLPARRSQQTIQDLIVFPGLSLDIIKKEILADKLLILPTSFTTIFVLLFFAMAVARLVRRRNATVVFSSFPRFILFPPSPPPGGGEVR